MRRLILSALFVITAAAGAQPVVPLASPNYSSLSVLGAVSDGSRIYLFGGNSWDSFGRVDTGGLLLDVPAQHLGFSSFMIKAMAAGGGVVAMVDGNHNLSAFSPEGATAWVSPGVAERVVFDGTNFVIIRMRGSFVSEMTIEVERITPGGKSLGSDLMTVAFPSPNLVAARIASGTVVLAWFGTDGIHTATVTNGKLVRRGIAAPAPGEITNLTVTEDLLVAQVRGSSVTARLFAAPFAADGTLGGDLTPITGFAPSDGSPPLAVKTGARELILWTAKNADGQRFAYAVDANAHDLQVSVPASRPATVTPVLAASANQLVMVTGATGGVLAPSSTPAAELLAMPDRPLLERQVTTHSPAIAWSGEHYVAAWQEEVQARLYTVVYGIATRRFTPDGVMLDERSTLIARGGTSPKVAANRDLSLVCWLEQTFTDAEQPVHLRCARVSSLGAVLDTAPIEFGMSEDQWGPVAVAANGRDFLVVFSGVDRVRARVITAGGQVRELSTPVPGAATSLRVAFDGTSYVVSVVQAGEITELGGIINIIWDFSFFTIDGATGAASVPQPLGKTSWSDVAVVAAHDGETLLANALHLVFLRNGTPAADIPLPFGAGFPRLAVWNGRAYVISNGSQLELLIADGPRFDWGGGWGPLQLGHPGGGSWCGVREEPADARNSRTIVEAKCYGPRRHAAVR